MREITNIKPNPVLLLIVGCLISNPVTAQTINIAPLPEKPEVDGRDTDWQTVNGEVVPVTGPLAVSSVLVKAGIHDDHIYFLFRWPDTQADTKHKPFIWDAEKKRYIKGPQREDRFAVQFAMAGEYDVNWLSGNSFRADMWHWKAARSNPLGLAHDKMTIIGTDPVRKAYKAKTDDGHTRYIQRPSDAGGKLYTTTRYRQYESDIMPKYLLNRSVTGSVADVKAKGVWHDGFWTLELQRKLNTGHADDVVFVSGKTIAGGITVFDRSGDDQHNISANLLFSISD